MNPTERVRDWTQKTTEFYGDVRGEMRKVSWPGRDEVVGTTIVVLIAVIFFGVFLGVVDYVLGQGFAGLIGMFGGG
jgi:preprotein translocase subunit SecE